MRTVTRVLGVPSRLGPRLWLRRSIGFLGQAPAPALGPVGEQVAEYRRLLAEQAEDQRQYEAAYREWQKSVQQTGFTPFTYVRKDIRIYPPTHPKLAEHWANYYHEWVLDLGIPASDWDAIVENFPAMREAWEEIPWFELAGKDYAKRCAKGMPFTVGKDGQPLSYNNPRLYAPTFSAYLPRQKEIIHTELATFFGANLEPLFGCIDHKFGKRMREIERSTKTAQFFQLILPPLIFPSLPIVIGAGVGMAASLINPEYAKYASVASGVLIVLASGGLGGAGVVAGGLAAKIGTSAFEATTTLMGAAIAQGFVKSAKDLVDAVSSLSGVPDEMAIFVLWILIYSQYGQIIAVAAAWLGYKVDFRKDIVQPLLDKAQAAGMPLFPYLLETADKQEEEVEEIIGEPEGKVGEAFLPEGEVFISDEEPDLGTLAAVGAGGLIVAVATGII